MAVINIIELTKTNFAAEALRCCVPVLVSFWAGWCKPCLMLRPILEDLAIEYEGQVKIATVNVDDHPELAKEYGISAVPTILLFKDGQVQDVIVGLKSKGDLESSLERVLTPP
ncbi:MAG: thioredoxin [Verrucomicrobiae bacterium]|nr:thioredoxin [Verrucomicrobiae bacterium]